MTTPPNTILKSNPFITGSINKSLLTPCRRIGLSRKSSSKTPEVSDSSLSAKKEVPISKKPRTPPEQDVLSKNINLKTARNNDFPKAVKRKVEESINDNIHLTKKEAKIKDVQISPITNESVSKKLKLQSDKNTDSNEQNKTKKKAKEKNNEKKENKSKVEKAVKKLELSETLTKPTLINKEELKESIVEIITLKEPVIKSSCEENVKKEKKLRRSLSLKKSISEPSDEDFDLEIRKPKTSIILHETEESKGTESSNFTIDLSSKINNLEESSPITIKTFTKPELTKKIIQLENDIKIKKQLVVDLKQAEIYKKKINVEELNRTTEKWLIGCGQAINDLFNLLKQHQSITMSSLLANLGVPQDIITNLVQLNIISID